MNMNDIDIESNNNIDDNNKEKCNITHYDDDNNGHNQQEQQQEKQQSQSPRPNTNKTSSIILLDNRQRSNNTNNKEEQTNTNHEEAARTRTTRSTPLLFLLKIFQTWPHVTSTLALTIIGWATFLILGGMFRWPTIGTNNPHRLNCEENYLEEPNCFCERIKRTSMMNIKQPVNTLSNLAYAITALFCAYAADSKRFPKRSWWNNIDVVDDKNNNNHHVVVNLMTYDNNKNRRYNYFTMSFCLVATNISYSSGFLHAGWTSWGGKVDSISMLMMFGWLSLFSIIKFWLLLTVVGCWTPENIQLATQIHKVLFSMIVVCLFIFYFTIGQNIKVQKYLNYISIGIAVLPEIGRYLYEKLFIFFFNFNFKKGQQQQQQQRTRTRTRTSSSSSYQYQAWWIGWTAIIIFLLGYIMQVLSKSGSRMCNPDSIFQGHALWHSLSALSLTFYFFFSVSGKFTLLLYDQAQAQAGENDMTAKTTLQKQTITSRRSSVIIDDELLDGRHSCTEELTEELEEEEDASEV